MIQRVTETDFLRAFEGSQYKNNFSYEGLTTLYDYFINLEEDTGEEMELDIVSIACEFNEYKNVQEYLENYSTDLMREDFETDEEFNEAVLEEISEKTSLLDIDGEAFIIRGF
jgi:uncharacterized alpha/beta hydrolase family protein